MATTPFRTPPATTSPPEDRERTWASRRGRAGVSSVEAVAVAAYQSALRAEPDAGQRLQLGVDLLPLLVLGCDHASITTVTGGRLEVRVATDDASRRADELQDELDEGPCLQSVRTGHSVVAQDLRAETRWVDWCSAAVGELGLTSALTVLLLSTLRPLGTLNLYADTADGLSSVDMALLHTLAGPLSRALLEDDPDLRPVVG